MSDAELNEPSKLSMEQRRVLGVLIEKSLTTPDAYPMTINGIVAGCNQKSNRAPLVSYDADDVEIVLDELRQMELVNVVISDSGRVERYRQLSRIVFGWSDQHVAIMGELMLRGRQQLGELRSRASRMIAIDSLDMLRQRLTELSDAGFVQSSGPLERRGIEVDHLLYLERGQELTPTPAPSPDGHAAAATPTATSVPSGSSPSELAELRAELATLRSQVESLTGEVNELRSKLDSVL